MDMEKLEGMIIDYIDNTLDAAGCRRVEHELETNPEAKRRYDELRELLNVMDQSRPVDPPQHLGARFETLLDQELKSKEKRMTVPFYRAAAAVALLVVGGGIGYLVNMKQNQRMQEMETRIAMLMQMMHNDLSASQRLQGVNVAMSMRTANDEITNVLVKLMNEDPNANVRLAALEALSRFVNEPAVREQIIRALPKQNDPVVQIAIIQLLVKIRETQIVDELKLIINDDKTIQAVKDEAYSGIMKLS